MQSNEQASRRKALFIRRRTSSDFFNLRQLIRPAARGMHHRQDIDRRFGLPVGHDERVVADDQLAGSDQPSGPPDGGMIFQHVHTILDGLDDPPRGGGVVSANVILDSPKIGKRFPQP